MYWRLLSEVCRAEEIEPKYGVIGVRGRDGELSLSLLVGLCACDRATTCGQYGRRLYQLRFNGGGFCGFWKSAEQFEHADGKLLGFGPELVCLIRLGHGIVLSCRRERSSAETTISHRGRNENRSIRFESSDRCPRG